MDSFTWKQKVAEQSGVRPADVATQIRAALKARGSRPTDAQVAEIAGQIVARINDKVSKTPIRFSACARGGRTCVDVTCE